ncbi:DivIVA domain-containing protein [Paenibacillus sp.]|uniref:DivIVA domain-containing protein n=1 Tax=Paenibacillus sp. TaxID=58172 RepID=UPI00283AB7C6|nr:DivIVA domain-containing protein [Paenibacillus sp.]
MKDQRPSAKQVMLTNYDIHNKDFSTAFNGYNKDEVNDFLDKIVKDYEAYNKIIRDLENEIKQLKKASRSDQLGLEERVRNLEIHCWGMSRG